MAGRVTFTFDDGISKNTDKLIAILAEEGIEATFFIIGETLKGGPDCLNKKKLQAIHEAGHTIGNHTWSHPDIRKLGVEELRAEIATANDEIEATIDQTIKYFRPPYGALNAAKRDLLEGMGLKVVLWNVDGQDWNVKRSREAMLAYYKTEFTRPEKHDYIVLQHDRRTDSVELVPEIAKIARDRGFKIVSLDEYYGDDELKS